MGLGLELGLGLGLGVGLGLGLGHGARQLQPRSLGRRERALERAHLQGWAVGGG